MHDAAAEKIEEIRQALESEYGDPDWNGLFSGTYSTTWDLQITPKDSPLYEALRLEGYQPFHFTLIPVPQDSGPQIITPNGQADGYMAKFVQVVGLRKEFRISPPDKERLAELVTARAKTITDAVQAELDLGPKRNIHDAA